MTTLNNRLVLSLAHRSLSGMILNALVEETAAKTKNELSELQHELNEHTQYYHCHHEQKNSPDPDFIEAKHPTVHVLLTGSPYVTQPGRSFDNWETVWTPGEQVLSKFIDTIGLNKFHRLPKEGEVRLNGKLVDVKQKDFTIYEGIETQLRKELTWIADNVKQHFNLYATTPVSEATILFPVEYASNEMGVQDVMEMLKDIFEREWSCKKGPLHGVKINLQIVTCPDALR